MIVPTWISRGFCCVALVACAGQAMSATVAVQVVDAAGAPLAEAAVFLEPLSVDRPADVLREEGAQPFVVDCVALPGDHLNCVLQSLLRFRRAVLCRGGDDLLDCHATIRKQFEPRRHEGSEHFAHRIIRYQGNNRNANRAIGFIHVANRGHQCTGFRNARPVDQARRAVVAGARVNLVQFDHVSIRSAPD